MLTLNRNQLIDVTERALATAVQTFLALWLATDLTDTRSAGVAAAAAGLSVIKGWLASVLPVGDDTASLV
jgi:hypothetical protein